MVQIKKIVVDTIENSYGVLDMDVFITKRGNFKHINSPRELGHCPICQEKHGLQSHHVIPKKLTARKGFLGELRIRICNDCHHKIHPENWYIEAIRRLIPQLRDMTKGAVEHLPIFQELLIIANGRELPKIKREQKDDE